MFQANLEAVEESEEALSGDVSSSVKVKVTHCLSKCSEKAQTVPIASCWVCEQWWVGTYVVLACEELRASGEMGEGPESNDHILTALWLASDVLICMFFNFVWL